MENDGKIERPDLLCNQHSLLRRGLGEALPASLSQRLLDVSKQIPAILQTDAQSDGVL